VNREPLRISGSTGIDIKLDIAGPGSRSYAFVIDWHIRLLFALGWLCGSWLLLKIISAMLPVPDASSTFLALVCGAPALCIYLFYHPVLEVLMRGRTPGKRRAGVRIVTRNGGTPGVAALLIRNIFRLLDSLPFFYVVGLACCFMTEQKLRIGDLAAGTLLVLDSESAAKTMAQLGTMVTHSGLAPALAELIHDLLERWPALDSRRRDELARAVLARADTSASAEQLAALGDAQLLQRLRQLLPGGAADRT
jgi:uncharacterized RDD family membrane protein YckC